MKKLLNLSCILLSFLPYASEAETQASTGYLLNSSGQIINLKGVCIRTGDWTPEKAIPECDPEVVAANQAKKTNSPAPVLKIGDEPVFDAPHPITPEKVR